MLNQEEFGCRRESGMLKFVKNETLHGVVIKNKITSNMENGCQKMFLYNGKLKPHGLGKKSIVKGWK